jgi:hypothetical protein
MKNIILLLSISCWFFSCEKCEIKPNKEISSYERRGRTSIKLPLPTITKIVIDGNSLGVGLGSTFGGYQKLLEDSGYSISNISISGQTTLQMIQNSLDVDSSIHDGNCILVVDEITNDLWYGVSSDTAYERIKRYCLERKQLYPNLLIVVITPTPRSNPGTPSLFEFNRISLIQKLKNNHTFCNILADVGSNPIIGYNGAEYNTNYYYDLVHHTDEGYIIRGNIILNSIKRISQ